MTVEEFEACVDSAIARIRAVMGDGDRATVTRDTDRLVFAGTGLPAYEIARHIDLQAIDSAQFLGVAPPWQILRACAMNTFWIGYECGRRAT